MVGTPGKITVVPTIVCHALLLQVQVHVVYYEPRKNSVQNIGLRPIYSSPLGLEHRGILEHHRTGKLGPGKLRLVNSGAYVLDHRGIFQAR